MNDTEKALKAGASLLENGHQILIEPLKNRKAKLYSLFRYGLNHLKHKLLNF